MKIVDYEIVNGTDRQDLVKMVRKGIAEGWEILGTPQLCLGGDYWWQAMVKRFDPHEGKVWLKLEGKRGQWVDPETAALALQSSS